MKKNRIFLLFLNICFLFLIFSSCAQKTPKEIIVFLPSADNPFWIEVRRGVENTASDLGKDYKITILSSGDLDAASQVEQLSSILSRGKVDAIVIGIADNKAPAPILSKYNKAKIPVVMIDTKLDEETSRTSGTTYNSFIGSNNRYGGHLAAQEMEKAIFAKNRGNKVLLIKGNYIHQSAIDRAEGFIEKGSDKLKIIERQGEWSRQRAMEITTAVMMREPVDGIFASNDDMALGVIAAFKNLGIAKNKMPIIIGFDATPNGIKAIKEGYMHASMKQDPIEMGRAGVMSAKNLLEGKPVEYEKLIPIKVAKK